MSLPYGMDVNNQIETMKSATRLTVTFSSASDTHDVLALQAKIMAWQEKEGWPFDVEKAQLLENKLRKELEALADEMRSTFQYVNGGEFCPKRNNSTKGWWAGAAFCRLRDFNPTSRQHIAWANPGRTAAL